MGETQEMVTYLAYGSNMLEERIKARAKDARPLGIASIVGKRLTFHKVGTRANGTKTGKCNIVEDETPEAVMYGVLYEMPKSQFDELNTHEGGYLIDQIVVNSPTLGEVTTKVHIADVTDEALIPYDWYKDLVLEGAIQHGIPENYIKETIESTRAETTDTNYRDAREAKALIEKVRNTREKVIS